MDIAEALARPFPAEMVKWKPQSIKGDRALAVAYIDARDVMDRLDEVVGLDGWQDEYKVLSGGDVECTLQVKLNGEWVSKSDVGAIGSTQDQGNDIKAAYSDALKRAAVKFGIGRYLYALPMHWHDYDAQRHQFKSMPALPAWAMPGKPSAPIPSPSTPKEVSFWEEFLADDPSVDSLNDAFKKNYETLPEGTTKDRVRAMLDKHVKLANLTYDPKNKQFKVKR